MNNIEIWNDWINTKTLDNKALSVINQMFNFVNDNFKNLKLEIKWNQPMFILGKTFIIGFSPYKNHLSIAPEQLAIDEFKKQLELNKYEYTNNLFKINYNQEIDFNLISDIIKFQINRKQDSKTFFS